MYLCILLRLFLAVLSYPRILENRDILHPKISMNVALRLNRSMILHVHNCSTPIISVMIPMQDINKASCGSAWAIPERRGTKWAELISPRELPLRDASSSVISGKICLRKCLRPETPFKTTWRPSLRSSRIHGRRHRRHRRPRSRRHHRPRHP